MKSNSRFSRNVYAISDRIWRNKHLRHTTTENITLGNVDTSDLMMIIAWAIDISFQSPILKWANWTHTTPYIVMKIKGNHDMCLRWCPYMKYMGITINTFHNFCNLYPLEFHSCIIVGTKHLHIYTNLMVVQPGIHRLRLIKLFSFHHAVMAFVRSINIHNGNSCTNIMRLCHVICLACNSQKAIKFCMISGVIC